MWTRRFPVFFCEGFFWYYLFFQMLLSFAHITRISLKTVRVAISLGSLSRDRFGFGRAACRAAVCYAGMCRVARVWTQESDVLWCLKSYTSKCIRIPGTLFDSSARCCALFQRVLAPLPRNVLEGNICSSYHYRYCPYHRRKACRRCQLSTRRSIHQTRWGKVPLLPSENTADNKIHS